MIITVRNITKDEEFDIQLPIKSKKIMKETFNHENEYIIIDHDQTLDLSEYDSIQDVNDFLIACQEEYEIDVEILKILSSHYTYREVKEMIIKGNYSIIDFSSATEGWNFGNGGDINSNDDKGRVLHDNGMMFDWENNNPITEEMMDYIKWEQLWFTAETLGWIVIHYDHKDYLVHK